MINTVCTHVCYNDKVHVKVDFDDVTNKPDLVTRDEIVTEFKTINGQEITGTGNIEISGGSGETIDTSNFATKDEVNTLSNNITNNYALKSEIPSLDGYAKTTDIPDISNLATKGEIVKDFKTINGQEITGTGNIEISNNVDTSNFARTDIPNTFNGDNVFEPTNIDSMCATFNGRTLFKNEINIEIDTIPKEDISKGTQCDMKQTYGQVATLYTGRILPPLNNTTSHSLNVINFGNYDNLKFVDGDGLYINGERLTDTYARKSEIPSLDGYAKTTDIPDISNLATKAEIVKEFKTINGETITGTGNIEISSNVDTSNFATKDEVNTLSNNITNNYALKNEIPSLDGYAKTTDIPDVSIYNPTNNFKTINGKSIIGTGDVNIVWTGTQEQYDALSDKSAYLFYLIH